MGGGPQMNIAGEILALELLRIVWASRRPEREVKWGERRKLGSDLARPRSSLR